MGTKYNRLKVVLAEQEKTNRWLAAAMEVGELTVSRWVTNTRQPDVETLYKIAATLSVDVCDLLVREKEGSEKTM